LFASGLQERLRNLLKGRNDPLWPKEIKDLYPAETFEKRQKSRWLRLIEALKTCEGIFQ
jgi:hypothetical protein